MQIIILGIVWMSDKDGLRRGAALGQTKVGIGCFVGDVDQPGKAEVLDLPGAVPVADVADVSIKAIGGHPQMEIPHGHAGIDVRRRGGVVAGHVEGPVIHDVVEIHPDPKTMGRPDHAQEFLPGAITGGDGAALVFVAQVEGIPQIVTGGVTAAALAGRRKPKTGVTGLGELRDFLVYLIPGEVKELENGVGPGVDERAEKEDGDREML